jgi:hypothetical protein
MRSRRGWLVLRAACALAAALAAAMLLQGYGPADSGPLEPAPGMRCTDAVSGRIIGQIRYDSGLTLRYCSLAAMFGKLASLEQPGAVRLAAVRGAGGHWLDATQARYRRSSTTQDWQAQAAGGTPPPDSSLSYAGLLHACAHGRCGLVISD